MSDSACKPAHRADLKTLNGRRLLLSTPLVCNHVASAGRDIQYYYIASVRKIYLYKGIIWEWQARETLPYE